MLFTMIYDEKQKSKLEIIYNLYRDKMAYLAYSIVENKYDAEDIVSETFVKLAKNIDRINDPEDYSTFLYVIKAVKNTAYNYIKKNENLKLVDIEDIENLPDDRFIASLEIQDNYDKVIEAISNMSEIYRDVMYYHFVTGMSDNEIADVLGRKPVTVKTQLVRGKQILLKELKEKGVGRK